MGTQAVQMKGVLLRLVRKALRDRDVCPAWAALVGSVKRAGSRAGSPVSLNMCLWFDRISLAGVQRRKPDVRGHRHAGGGGDRLLREEPGGGARQA